MTEKQEMNLEFERWWNTMGASKACRILALCPTGYPNEQEVKEKVREIWEDGYQFCMNLMVNR